MRQLSSVISTKSKGGGVMCVRRNKMINEKII